MNVKFERKEKQLKKLFLSKCTCTHISLFRVYLPKETNQVAKFLSFPSFPKYERINTKRPPTPSVCCILKQTNLAKNYFMLFNWEKTSKMYLKVFWLLSFFRQYLLLHLHVDKFWRRKNERDFCWVEFSKVRALPHFRLKKIKLSIFFLSAQRRLSGRYFFQFQFYNSFY